MPVPSFLLPAWQPGEHLVISAPPAVGWRVANTLFRQHGGKAEYIRSRVPERGTKRWWKNRVVFADLPPALDYAEHIGEERIRQNIVGSPIVFYADIRYENDENTDRVDRLIRVGSFLGISVVALICEFDIVGYDDYPASAYIHR